MSILTGIMTRTGRSAFRAGLAALFFLPPGMCFCLGASADESSMESSHSGGCCASVEVPPVDGLVISPLAAPATECCGRAGACSMQENDKRGDERRVVISDLGQPLVSFPTSFILPLAADSALPHAVPRSPVRTSLKCALHLLNGVLIR